MSNKASDLKNKQMFQSNAKYATHLNWSGLKCALLVSLLICSVWSFGQGWEVRVGGSKEDQAKAVIATVDHGNLLVGFSESYGDDNDIDILAIRTDVDGTIIWQKIYDESFHEQPNAVIELEDGSFVMAGYIREKFNAPNNVYMLKVHRTGRKIWSKTFTTNLNEKAFDIAQTADGGFILVGETENAATGRSDILVLKADADGEEEWRNAFGISDKDDIGKGVVAVSDGYILVADVPENNGVAKNVALYKLDLRGNFVWSKSYGTSGEHEEINDLLLTQNDEIVFVGTAGNYSRGLIAKCNLQGDTLWYRELRPAAYDNWLSSVIEMPDGHLVAVGYSFVNAAYSKATLLKLDSDGEIVWQRLVGNDKSINIGEDVALSANDGFVIAGYTNGSADVLSLINDVLLTKVNGDGLYPSNHLMGQVTHLLDGCDGVDGVPLSDWLVEVEGEENSYYGTTDENGRYDISVAPGSYKVTLLKPNDHWGVCNPVAFFAEFSELYDTTVTNFTAYTAEECPFMDVDVTVPFITNGQIQCDDAVYTLNYCNLGPVVAENAYVTVRLDDELAFVQDPSYPAPSNIDAETNTLTYQLGDVPSMDCGQIKIKVALDCEGLTDGKALTVKADIYPNEICSDPDPNWDHASLDLSVECVSDTVRFKIENVGEEPMQVPSEYIVVEDILIFLQGPIDPLGPKEERYVTVPGVSGKTYRMIARQSDGHPGHSLPTVAIEGCAAENGVGDTGYYADFPENDQDANVDIDVQEVISPEKTTLLKGHPNGYKDYILDQKTDIEYTIIFSNIWTDTINRVVIRDTLSPHLDVYSVEPGASSHPYDFEIYNNGIVKFTLSEIQLQPVGSAEEASSRGFVKFRISQKPNNPLGTEITNSAAVYFDYHAPEVTNSVDYVIGCTDFLQQGCLEIQTKVTDFFPGVKIKVAPNPFFDRATIDIEGITLNEVEVVVYDMMGRLVRSEKHRANQFEVYRDNLPSGMYMFRLLTGGQTLATGKLIAR
ncbi:MAG: T9SS type A sorting domain-containing protein [Saprospiraceae bacterium]|nr:T9SS type A sorting domain-containing protein [Lewinella sp.]